MSYQEDTIDWQVIEQVDEWLDNSPDLAPVYQGTLAQDWARISKVAEELGEAISAFIGSTGQNPRKGITNSEGDVLDELADTALTAIFAMQHFTKSSSKVRDILRAKQIRIFDRMRKAQSG